MKRTIKSLKDLWLTGFLVVSFLLAGCWANTAETSRPETQSVSTSAADLQPEDQVEPPSSENAEKLTAAVETPEFEEPEAASKIPDVAAPKNIVLTAAEVTKPETKAAADRAPEPMLKGWKIPKLALVLSGEQ